MSFDPPPPFPSDRVAAGWLFATPFRPFFLGASIHAALMVPAWIVMRRLGTAEVAGLPAHLWHAHEMVFGFMPAVMAGYLLAATPNWSGRLPASGKPLALLFSLWLAGRIAPLMVSAPVAGLSDLMFPLAMAAILAREGRHRKGGQSRHGLMLFPILGAASLAHRLLAGDPAIASTLAVTGVAVGALMIAAVGGRLVPSLTRNALAGRGAERVPEPYGRFDVAVLLATAAGLLAMVLVEDGPATAALALLAGGLNLVRLARWRGWLLRGGDGTALHAGYLWLPVGLILAGLSAAGLDVTPDAALHALSAGAIGGMTMAVMARLASTRGKGGRANRRLAAIALLSVHAGACLRVAAPMVVEAYEPLLAAAATAWSAGFALFAVAQIAGGRQRAEAATSPLAGQRKSSRGGVKLSTSRPGARARTPCTSPDGTM